MAIASAQYEMMLLKKLLESKSAELLSKLPFDLFANTDIANIFKLVGVLYSDSGAVPSFDLLKAELMGRVTNAEKLRLYVGLVDDIRDKDCTDVTTDFIVEKLKEQKQFRIILAGADSLVSAVERRDTAESMAALREMYDKLFAEATGANSFDAADMVSMAGQSIKFNFHKTGLTQLDKRGPWIEDGVLIIGGESKAGKSLLAQQVCLYGYDEYDESCAYYTFEQTQSELRTRVLSYRSQLDIGLISSDLLNTEQRLHLREAEVRHLCYFDDNMLDFIRSTARLPEKEFWELFWNSFKPRDSRFLLMASRPDWDSLFCQMKLLVDTRKIKKFAIDYPFLIGRGRTQPSLASWQYALEMQQALKTFAGQNNVRVVTPAQFDSAADSLRYVKGAINSCDCFIKIKQEEGDKEYGEQGAVTIDWGVFRNYLSVVGEPFLQPFKLLKKFNVACFENFDF